MEDLEIIEYNNKIEGEYPVILLNENLIESETFENINIIEDSISNNSFIEEIPITNKHSIKESLISKDSIIGSIDLGSPIWIKRPKKKSMCSPLFKECFLKEFNSDSDKEKVRNNLDIYSKQQINSLLDEISKLSNTNKNQIDLLKNNINKIEAGQGIKLTIIPLSNGINKLIISADNTLLEIIPGDTLPLPSHKYLNKIILLSITRDKYICYKQNGLYFWEKIGENNVYPESGLFAKYITGFNNEIITVSYKNLNNLWNQLNL